MFTRHLHLPDPSSLTECRDVTLQLCHIQTPTHIPQAEPLCKLLPGSWLPCTDQTIILSHQNNFQETSTRTYFQIYSNIIEQLNSLCMHVCMQKKQDKIICYYQAFHTQKQTIRRKMTAKSDLTNAFLKVPTNKIHYKAEKQKTKSRKKCLHYIC